MAEKYNNMLREMLVDKQENASYRFFRDLQSYSNELLASRWNIFSQRNGRGLDNILELQSIIENFYDNIYSKINIELKDKDDWETESFKKVKKYLEIFSNKGVRKLLVEFNPTFGQKPIIKKCRKYRYKTEQERSERYAVLKVKKDRTSAEQEEFNQIVKHYTTPRFLEEEDGFGFKPKRYGIVEKTMPRHTTAYVEQTGENDFSVFDRFDGREYRFRYIGDAESYQEILEDINNLRISRPDRVEQGKGYYGMNYSDGRAILFSSLATAVNYSHGSMVVNKKVTKETQQAPVPEPPGQYYTASSGDPVSFVDAKQYVPIKGLWEQMYESEKEKVQVKDSDTKESLLKHKARLYTEYKKYVNQMDTGRCNLKK